MDFNTIADFAQQNFILVAAWVGIAGMLGYTVFTSLLSPIKTVNQQQATLLINREDALVLDIRPAKEFRSGHIAGAHHLSSEDIGKNNYSKLKAHRDKPVIVVCASGMSARGVASKLYKEGFSQPKVLDGGMRDWIGANLPVSKS